MGRCHFEDGKSHVSLNLVFDGTEDWLVAIGPLAEGLRVVSERNKPEVALTIRTSRDSVVEVQGEQRMLIEYFVKQKNYKWDFHKNDADHWPSALHAHEYDQNLVLDAINGEIYCKASRKVIKKLKPKKLLNIHDKLRESKEFGDRIDRLLAGK